MKDITIDEVRNYTKFTTKTLQFVTRILEFVGSGFRNYSLQAFCYIIKTPYDTTKQNNA